MLFLLALCLFAAQAGAGDHLSHGAKARELMTRGEYELALDELKTGLSLFPYDQALRQNLASAHARTAQRYLELSRYDQAAEHFALARELAPGAGELGFMRGVALYLGKNYDAARAELLAAGDRAEPLAYLGRISYDQGDLAGAVTLWQRALELNPELKGITGLIEKAERELPVESKMDKGYSSMFDLSFDAELPPGLSADVLDALESAYNSVGADLGHFPTARIPVLLYTKSDYGSVTAGPDWSGGLYDGKIRLPVGGVTRVTPLMRAIIFHEFTHVLIAELGHGNVPTWLNEGLAEIQGRREFTPAVRGSNPAVGGRLLPLSTLSGAFTAMGGDEAALAYRQSHSMAQFMVSRYGWYAMREILRHLGERATIESAVAQALSDWSLDLDAVMREWRESLPAETDASVHPDW